MTPKISLVAFEDRKRLFLFVSIPNQVGRYVRTDPSVAHVACPYCGADIGEPCHKHSAKVAPADRQYRGGTHSDRRVTYHRRYWRDIPRPETDDVVCATDGTELDLMDQYDNERKP